MSDDVKRVSREEARSIQAKLQIWQSVDEFTHVMSLTASWDEAPMYQPELGFYRDAWVALQVARCLQVDAVRLGSDFETCKGDEHVFWEATEADVPGRKRGDEYKKLARVRRPVVLDDPVEAWDARTEQIPLALTAVSQKKSQKTYPRGTNLVILLNISDYKDRSAFFRSIVHEATKCSSGKFERIWVLWLSTLYLVWENGNQVFEKHVDPEAYNLAK